MLSIHSARQRGHNGKIGLAIAGGGPIGGMYELGALRALDEALDGLDLTRMDCYVGVSSGAFLAAGLANRMGTAEMCRIFITGTSDDAEFRPETFLRPNVGEYLRRAATLPGLYADWLSRLMRNPRRATRWSDLFLRFGGLVPTGLLDNPAVIEVAPRNSTAERIEQLVHPCDKANKIALLSHLVTSNDWQQVLVFTRTKHMANRVAETLDKNGVSAAAIHGNKSQGARTRALAGFKDGNVKVLVATDIAARGLDIDKLPQVVNFELPNVAEDYVHRIGRTGRAGNDGLAISLICHGDWNLMSSIERYLKQSFERRTIKEVKGTYTGPKKVKASGKAAGVKKKKTDKKTDKKVVAKRKPTAKPKPNAPSLVSQDGMAPLKKRKPAPAAE